MTISLYCLLGAVVLTWIQLVFASLYRARAWNIKGMIYGMGNREHPPENLLPSMARADRAAKNMLENLVLFIGIIACVHLSNRHNETVDLGAQIFLGSRIAYFFIYLAGVPIFRTVAWAMSIAGLGIIVMQLI